MWSASQRWVIAVLMLIVSTVLAVMCWFQPQTVSDPQPVEGRRAGEIVGKLDPNIADAASLSALPGLGEKRALAIVAYRDIARRHHPERPAFESMQDLSLVEGIGPSTLANLQPYLSIPATR